MLMRYQLKNSDHDSTESTPAATAREIDEANAFALGLNDGDKQIIVDDYNSLHSPTNLFDELFFEPTDSHDIPFSDELLTSPEFPFSTEPKNADLEIVENQTQTNELSVVRKGMSAFINTPLRELHRFLLTTDQCNDAAQAVGLNYTQFSGYLQGCSMAAFPTLGIKTLAYRFLKATTPEQMQAILQDRYDLPLFAFKRSVTASSTHTSSLRKFSLFSPSDNESDNQKRPANSADVNEQTKKPKLGHSVIVID